MRREGVSVADEQLWPTPRYAEEIVFEGRARLHMPPQQAASVVRGGEMKQEDYNDMMRLPGERVRQASRLPVCPKCGGAYCGNGESLCVECEHERAVLDKALGRSMSEVPDPEIAALRAQLEQAQAERDNLVFRNDSLREQTTQLLIQRDNLVIAQDRLKATIARQREWIEKAGHRRKCSVRAPHAATMDYKPTCDCGYSELTEN